MSAKPTARQVIEAIKADPELARAVVADREARHIMYDNTPIVRARAQGKQEHRKQASRWLDEDNGPEVRDFIEQLRRYRKELSKRDLEFMVPKFSPEAGSFTYRLIDSVIRDLRKIQAALPGLAGREG